MPEETKIAEINYEKTTKISELEEPAACVNGHNFLVKNCKLIPFTGKDLVGEVMFADNNFILNSGFTVDPVNGFLLACPVCGLIHLSGFEPPVPDVALSTGIQNFIEDRNFAL